MRSFLGLSRRHLTPHFACGTDSAPGGDHLSSVFHLPPRHASPLEHGDRRQSTRYWLKETTSSLPPNETTAYTPRDERHGSLQHRRELGLPGRSAWRMGQGRGARRRNDASCADRRWHSDQARAGRRVGRDPVEGRTRWCSRRAVTRTRATAASASSTLAATPMPYLPRCRTAHIPPAGRLHGFPPGVPARRAPRCLRIAQRWRPPTASLQMQRQPEIRA